MRKVCLDSTSKLEKAIKKRVEFKYILIVLLIVFTVTFTVGALFENSIAILAYFGILVLVFVIIRYPFSSIYFGSLSQQDYAIMLKLLTKNDTKKVSYTYLETIYILQEEINRLLYRNDIKERYYQEKRDILSICYEEAMNVLKTKEIGSYRKYRIQESLLNYLLLFILVGYLIFKIIVTLVFYDYVNTSMIIKVTYNIGADFIAVVAAIVNRQAEEKK